MRIRKLHAWVWLVLLCACGGAQRGTDRRVCVVLSSGGPKGIAHLGALRALQQHATFPIECVTGTSMGALTGSLYATNPNADPVERYRGLMTAYESKARQEASNAGFLGALFGFLTGGIGFAVVAGAATASSVDPVQHRRMVATMDEYYGHATIETMPLSYATFFHDLAGGEPSLVTVRTGNVADAVGKSVANPLIFPDVDPRSQGYVDPGLDRVAAVPIEATCEAYPGSLIFAVNVTNEEAFYRDRGCEVVEVRIDAEGARNEALNPSTADFTNLTAVGERAAIASLREMGAYRDSPRPTRHQGVD